MSERPRTMRGVWLTGHGDLDKLEVRSDIPVPHRGPREVLIRVAAAGVNNTDINTRTAWYSKKDGASEDASWAGAPIHFPRIQGADVCGRIVAVGEEVSADRISERVLIEPCHFHMLFLDGVYVEHPAGAVRLRWVNAPTSAELTELAQRIAQRVGRYLERQGLLQRDARNSYLAGEVIDEGPMDPLWGHSITWRIAVGPQAGRKVLTLQTLPAGDPAQAGGAGNVGGFSLHAGVAVRANQRNKRERLCRTISRPALSEQRLSLTAGGKVRYQLKTPYNNGTTHVVFEALDFLARLAALVPRPRVNLTRYHGVFAPNSAHRALVTRAGPGNGRASVARAESRTPAERRAAMRWAQRLKRVFGIDVETCAGCGGTMRIIACIEDTVVIKAILAHLAGKARPVHAPRLPPGRAPPAPAFS